MRLVPRYGLALGALTCACAGAPPSPTPLTVDVPARPVTTAASPSPRSCNATLLKLPFGRSVHRADAYVVNEADERADIEGAMPSLFALNLRLLSATAIELAGDASARFVFLAPLGAEEERVDRGTFSGLLSGIAACGADGYALVGPPTPVIANMRPSVLEVERLSLPNGSAVTSIMTELTGQDYEREVFILGASAPGFPVLAGAKPTRGVIVRAGVMQEGHLTAANDWVTSEQLDASGWYPAGPSVAYLQLRRGKTEVRANFRTVVDANGAVTYPDHAPDRAWALVGTGPPPASCVDLPPASSSRLRCRRVTVPQHFIVPPVQWVAGVFRDAASARAARSAMSLDSSPDAANRTRWLAVNVGERTSLLDPDGAPALLALGLTRMPLPPPPPRH